MEFKVQGESLEKLKLDLEKKYYADNLKIEFLIDFLSLKFKGKHILVYKLEEIGYKISQLFKNKQLSTKELLDDDVSKSYLLYDFLDNNFDYSVRYFSIVGLPMFSQTEIQKIIEFINTDYNLGEINKWIDYLKGEEETKCLD